ncbi:probable 3-hydroxyisobutyrate dehydrogenase, mitochondrial [Impatiens glandulifera]|uniref:probable 3-hydroxyisobutyrate dehydrogenase, mitochondrial n=1 Tax=Impatiens glandulifera TaxID=253017 RepID=UPI001FB17A22|nr:probable 3-hydroxyisobutyrate dehydrogenase, mitochondrial [Impatiens glandulifera]
MRETMKTTMAITRARSLLSLSLHRFFVSSLSKSPPIRRFSSSAAQQPQFDKVGFLGLGNMGSRMANNLIKAGFDVIVHDINPGAVKAFTDKGIVAKSSPFEVAELSDVVITMLPSSVHVLDVYLGANGLINNGNVVRPWLFIDSSTIDPQTSRRISMVVSQCGLNEKKGWTDSPLILDAPVSGGVGAAESGTLTFMVGGSKEAFLAAEPLFLAMGKNPIYCGGAGNGSGAKICNNLAMAVSMMGVSEALALGQSLGISANTLTKIFNSSSARCWSSDTYNPVPGVMEGVPSSRNYYGGFASKLMAKDLSLATTSARQVGVKCTLSSQAEEIYKELCNDGHDAEDFSSVFRHYYSGKDEY